MEEVLKISNLTKNYGSRVAINDISTTVNSGEIVGFIGPNGSGKTTTIKCIFGLITPDNGDIEICGYDIKTNRETAISYVGGIIENPEFYKYLSGKENLRLFANMYNQKISDDYIDELLNLVELYDRKDDHVGKYSLGMKQRLGIAQALLNKPKLLILDEPTNGLDPEGIILLRKIIVNLSKQGTGIFISSHQLAELDMICSKFIMITKGEVKAQLSYDEIHTNIEDGKLSFIIETDEDSVEIVKDILNQNNIEFKANDNRKITIITTDNQAKQNIIKLLVDNNVVIVSINDIKKTIEESFMSILSENVKEGQ